MNKLREEWKTCLKRIFQISEINGWGDPFIGNRMKEIDMAIVLGHTLSETISGADAYFKNVPKEYKSSTDKLVGYYSNISSQNTWEEQKTYLEEEKILKYDEHFFSKYIDGEIQEIWCVPAEIILKLLLPKIKKQFDLIDDKRKDKRIRVVLGESSIRKNGKLVFSKEVKNNLAAFFQK